MSNQPKPTGIIQTTAVEDVIKQRANLEIDYPQPKPTGEWTGLILSRLIKEKGYKGIADAHNAALAAVQRIADNSIVENVRLMNELASEREAHAKALLAKQTRIEIFQSELAVEQEKVQTFLDALRDSKSNLISMRTFLACGEQFNDRDRERFTKLMVKIDAALAKVGK